MTATKGAALAMTGAGVVGVSAVTLLGLSILIAWNAIAYAKLAWSLPLAAGVVALCLVAITNLVAGYIAEGRSRRAVIGLFGQYVAPQLVARMSNNPDN